MHLLIEKGLKGGISYVAKRYSKANNKYMEDYDSSKESTFIIYLNANNLFGRAISQYLPYDGLKWLTKEEIKNFAVNSISENSLDGYILKSLT